VDISTIVIAFTAVLVLALVLFLVLRRASRTGPQPTAGMLDKTASTLGAALRRAWGPGLDDSAWDRIEEALIAADVGATSASEITAAVRRENPNDAGEARRLLAGQLKSFFGGKDRSLSLRGRPAVVLVVGVNGTGKTTTIAKLASRLIGEGRRVILAGADTFRAGAGEQLKTWAGRVGVNVVVGHEGGDPASVVYDALESARAGSDDVLIVDTAGRLHGKKNLMAELEKIHRVSGGEGGVAEVLLVLDATAGQNGLTQVSEFAKAVPLTGVVLTKLDGTARGGIVVAVERQLDIPVKFVGLGEALDDLEPFDPDSFVDELLEES